MDDGRSRSIRNFCIIAHINHGKSTLADRILEFTGAIGERGMREQVLDDMDLERERGITIKASAVRLAYRARDGREYILNLIDTPGHVDFSYEVSRALAACEGAVLVVDASQGVEAQTVANLLLALDHHLAVLPVINKIDLESAQPEVVRAELFEELALDPDEAILASAKEGIGTEEILEAIVHRVPPPPGRADEPLRCLIFDSKYDPHRGIIGFIRVMSGRIAEGMEIRMMSTGDTYRVDSVGIFAPEMRESPQLAAGEVGFVTAGVKSMRDMRVGDTITEAARPAEAALPGCREPKPMVFCGLFPVEATGFDHLRDALERLQLNDAAFSFERESSEALGLGFRAGFLGLLHMEIVQERLEREYGLKLITTTPNAGYTLHLLDGRTVEIDNPADFPSPDRIVEVQEPYVRARIITPEEYVGSCMEICEARRGDFEDMRYSGGTGNGDPGSVIGKRVHLTYVLPLSEILVDFFDQLKSVSRGYASLDYEIIAKRPSDLVRVDILLNGEPVDALSFIVHRSRSYERARDIVDRLRDLLPRQLFKISVQAAIGKKVIAANSVRALRKNVLAKCYGGDVTRKRKLLEKQKEGKKRLKRIGSVEIPQEAFMALHRRRG